MSEMIQNACKCLKCGTIIKSNSRYDFNKCSCGDLFVDGGLEYSRIGGESLSDDNYESLVLYDEDDDNSMVNKMIWGTYGKNGDEELKYVKLKDCTTGHLEAILANCRYISDNTRNVINIILDNRKLNIDYFII